METRASLAEICGRVDGKMQELLSGSFFMAAKPWCVVPGVWVGFLFVRLGWFFVPCALSEPWFSLIASAISTHSHPLLLLGLATLE